MRRSVIFRHSRLLLVVLIAMVTSRTLVTSAGAELDGRLGGEASSFAERYGNPVPDGEGSGNVYAVEGFGAVTVQFNRSGGDPRPDDPALFIVLQAPRPVDWPALEPYETDWSVEEAAERARDFLPTDAVLESTAEAETGAPVSTPCRSEALERRFGVLSLGKCAVTRLQPTPETVSFVILSLTGGTSSDPSAQSDVDESGCEGTVAWSAETSERLSAARSLLEQASAIDPSTTAIAEELSTLAETIGALADSQRSATAPSAAATANYYVISALSGYANAVALAATATAATDAAEMDEAVEEIGRANEAVSAAVEEIEAAVEACGLLVVTVTPSVEPEE